MTGVGEEVSGIRAAALFVRSLISGFAAELGVKAVISSGVTWSGLEAGDPVSSTRPGTSVLSQVSLSALR